MDSYGVPLGLALVLMVTAVSVLIGKRAARSVQEFRDEEHESFIGRSDP